MRVVRLLRSLSVLGTTTRSFHMSSRSSAMIENRHVILSSRPGICGAPRPENFSCEPCEPVDPDTLKDNEVLIKTCYLSVDPAQRCQMNETTGADYVPPWAVGESLTGLAGVGAVVASRHPAYSPGHLLYGSPRFPWKEYFVDDMKQEAENYQILDTSVFGPHPSLAVSLLGIPGLTSYLGLRVKGHLTPGGGQTCVVSGAAGSCGSVAGQVARLMGCSSVIGICGSGAKCSWLTEELGFDNSINYRTEDVGARLGALCPKGVHVYFDNVGGPISDDVINQMAANSHIVLCGQIALYNQDTPHVPPLPDHSERIVRQRQITRDEYLVLDYEDQFPEALAQLQKWYNEGEIKVRETVTHGLETVGHAFCSMMTGDNIGKQLIHVSDP